MTIRIGTSGWSYDHWTGVLYRRGLPAVGRLGAYAAVFDTVELNASFYRWPPPPRFQRWKERLPPGFAMSVKAPRGLTHGSRLSEPDAWIDRIDAGMRALGGRGAAVLVQLPPTMERDDDLLRHFLQRMPENIRVAVELRHPSWEDSDVYELLERNRAAYCVMSGAGLTCILRATTDFVYVRLHGPDPERLYAGSYSDDDMRWWADRIREWDGAARDVLAYFNNDGAGNAVRNARTLKTLLAQ